MRSSSRRTTEGRTRTRTTWWGASGYVTSRVTVREVGLYISSACNRRNSQGHSPSNTTLHDKRATAMNSVFTSEHMVCLCCHVFVQKGKTQDSYTVGTKNYINSRQSRVVLSVSETISIKIRQSICLLCWYGSQLHESRQNIDKYYAIVSSL